MVEQGTENPRVRGSIPFLATIFFLDRKEFLDRKCRRNQHTLLFSVPVYATAAVVQGLAGLLVDGGIFLGDADTRIALLCLILLPTVGGHTLAMYLLRHVKSQMVTLSVPAQFILGTLAAVVLFHETPTPEFLAGALVVMAGVVLGVLKRESVTSA